MFVRVVITTALTGLFLSSTTAGVSPAEDLLSGPAIENEEVTDQDMQSRRLQETGKKSNINVRQQMKYWMSALESIELTRSQQLETKAIIEELQIKQQEFQKMHGAELAKIREEQRKANNAAFAAQAASEAENAHVLMGLAPDPTLYQERAWELLTPVQQAAFQKKYQSIIAEELKRREERLGSDHSVGDAMMQRGADRKKGEDGITRRRNDRLNGQGNVDNDKALQRIRFLRRLQELKTD